VLFPQYVGLEIRLPKAEGGEEIVLLMEEKNIIGKLQEAVFE